MPAPKRMKLILNSFPEDIVKKTASCYNKAFHSKVFTLFASSESELFGFAMRSPVYYGYCFSFNINDEGQWFLDPNGILKVRGWVVNSCRKNTDNIFRIYSFWEKDWKRYTKICEKLMKTGLKQLSDRKLFDLFEEFYIQYIFAGGAAYMADSFMSTGEHDWLEEYLKEELKQARLDGKEIIQAVRTLTSPVHLSFALEAEYHLLKIGALIEQELGHLPDFDTIKKDYPNIHELLLGHEKRFFWIQNNYYNVHYIPAEEFYSQLKPFFEESKNNNLKISSLVLRKKEELQSLKQSKEKLMNKLPLKREAKSIIEVARLFSKWKDIRKAGVYIGMHHFDVFLEEIAKRSGYTKKELTFSVFNEIEAILLKKKDMHAELREREEKCFFALTPKGYFISSGKDADKYFKYLKVEDMRSVVELKGVVASPGYARARIHIIRKTDDMKSFEKGEILVTNQTTPEFVPVMRKAAAIITEQGGITSHAAVVSRELKVPCIIGVKNATHYLMDGETVEVDATNGVIRRLR